MSAILTFRFILPFNAAALSTNDVFIIVESACIFNLNRFILSVKADPELAVNISILFDNDTVSLAILLLSIFAVSAILTFKFILPFNAKALSTNEVLIFVESDLILVTNTFESKRIFSLTNLMLSPKAPSVAPANKSILLDKDAVSRAILLLSIKAVSEN